MDTKADVVVLWKAPQPGRDAASELRIGFALENYPGQGPYFTTELLVALAFEAVYKNGLQEIRVPASLLAEWLEQGVLQEDAYYPPRRSFHVPADKLAEFNRQVTMLVTRYHAPDEIE